MNSAKWLLVAIVVVAITLAVYVYFQSKNKIVVTSFVPQVQAAITNKHYLEVKLEETGLWKDGNVSFYQGAFVTPVTVKRLDIRLVDQPQQWGRLVDNPTSASPKVFRSFGEQYDPVSQTLFILLHVDRSGISKRDINRKYSAQLLTALYDITHRATETNKMGEDRLAGLDTFLSDYINGKINDGEVIITIK